MSIFNDKALKGVAEAAAKIMAETSHGLKGNQHKIDANKNGKIDAHDFKLLRAGKKPAMKKEEVEQIDELSRSSLASYTNKAARNMSTMTGIAAKQTTPGGNPKKGTEEKAKKIANTISKRMHGINKATSRLAKEEVELNEETEQLQEYESKGGTYQHKGNYGTSYKTDEEGNEIKPAKQKGYGARQNYVRGTSTGEKKKMKEELSFTEMLELYNEHGLKVLAPIETEEMDIDGTTVEVIDADKVNGVVATIVEEPTNDEFTKEYEDQKASFEGKKKQPKVAAGKTTGVKVMPEEVELDERTLTSGEAKKKEEYVKGMKKGLSGFKQRYGERAKSVMYATATKMAKKD